MKNLIAALLDRYESRRIDRRRLVEALAVLCTATRPLPAAASTFRGMEINHIALRVSNVPRSRDFYGNHLGMSVVRESSTSCFLGLGRHFVALFQNRNPGMDHFCVAIENFDAGRATDQLRRLGLNPERPTGSDRVYFPDPDGLTVQLSAVDHRP